MTDRRFQFPAGRHPQADGFALAELLLSLSILSIMMMLILPAIKFTSEAYYTFPEHYTRLKSEALLTGEPREYDDETEMEYPPIRFDENGIVNQARTLTFPHQSTEKQIIIELATGTLVFR